MSDQLIEPNHVLEVITSNPNNDVLVSQGTCNLLSMSTVQHGLVSTELAASLYQVCTQNPAVGAGAGPGNWRSGWVSTTQAEFHVWGSRWNPKKQGAIPDVAYVPVGSTTAAQRNVFLADPSYHPPLVIEVESTSENMLGALRKMRKIWRIGVQQQAHPSPPTLLGLIVAIEDMLFIEVKAAAAGQRGSLITHGIPPAPTGTTTNINANIIRRMFETSNINPPHPRAQSHFYEAVQYLVNEKNLVLTVYPIPPVGAPFIYLPPPGIVGPIGLGAWTFDLQQISVILTNN
jgi:hypothetical protein